MHEDRKLYLVFEFLDVDLKKHMDLAPQTFRDASVVKVSEGPAAGAGCSAGTPRLPHAPRRRLLMPRPASSLPPPRPLFLSRSGTCTRCCRASRTATRTGAPRLLLPFAWLSTVAGGAHARCSNRLPAGCRLLLLLMPLHTLSLDLLAASCTAT